jgi:hypothetical protein
LPFLERLTLPATVRLIEIIDSTGLVDLKVGSKLGLRPSRVTVSVSSRPSSRLAAAPGWLTSSCLAKARS